MVYTAIIFFLTLLGEHQLEAGIHRAPIIVQAYKLRQATRYPLKQYRLYRRGKNGEAVMIPFQIDEVNQVGDFVLPNGEGQNSQTSNGIFDHYDELSFWQYKFLFTSWSEQNFYGEQSFLYLEAFYRGKMDHLGMNLGKRQCWNV